VNIPAVVNPASFRDPSGAVFSVGREIFRSVHQSYESNFRALINSGLYKELTRDGRLIPHVEVEPSSLSEGVSRVIKPDFIEFISYPHEWSFSQYKEAALLTLDIQWTALKHGMTLKDASAYNVQFHNGKAIFIDTLSFESYTPGAPWVAYRQFCQHFLAPLTVMSYCDVRLNKLCQNFIDGIPLDLASSIVPWKTKLKPGLLIHLYFHARMQNKFAGKTKAGPKDVGKISLHAQEALIDSLRSTIQRLKWDAAGTEWADYYEATNYTVDSMREKENLVRSWLLETKPRTVWDLGANTGRFSTIAAEVAKLVVAFDIDPAAVDRNYREVRRSGKTAILPLILDLTNPSMGFGWAGIERNGLLDRGPADVVIALALIHHLAISNNVPLPMVAKFFSMCGKNLIIEFVPKSDSQVKRLLATRQDIFGNYTEASFENIFAEFYRIVAKAPVADSDRILYRMERQ